ncbi:3-oxoacyl-[acyl-carrier-protein] synthase [Geminocystis sp. NIES-3708]|uniref:thiamine pyrophosphate-dependent enzyme n=1 Tax=Geminocystis sp. NIES-3708 TaxID=1615909 RepID=UPI0005FC6986|nr:thiamine pyrophosphate-dependent enzyme [Geminocystis sp. NIES-3708]BAQ61814.1 3-oxoacyl-[acyl-carrier-protein] synthase [Geminocystis sp. NIES-3708]
MSDSILHSNPSPLSPDLLNQFLNLYQNMITAREIDYIEEQYVTQGEAFFHVSGGGHEAVAMLNPHLISADYLHLHYRDKALMLARGISPEMFFHSLFAKNDSHSRGRQMSAFMSDRNTNIVNMVVLVGNNALQAVGIAAQIKENPNHPLVVCALGDGTTQQGEVIEAIGEAVRFSLPVLFLIEDNRFSISTVTDKKTFYKLPDQTPETFYGLPIHRVKGWDCIACYETFEKIISSIRHTRKPALIVMTLERLNSHTNADDQTLYRQVSEIDRIRAEADPIKNLRNYLQQLGVTTKELEKIDADIQKSVKNAAKKSQSSCDPQAIFHAKKTLSHGLSDPSSEYTGYNSANRLTMREAICKVFWHRMKREPQITLYGEDIEDPKGDVFGLTKGLSTEFPGRIINSPLSESTIIGTCIGRALAGGRPVAFLQFADFMPLAFNQIISELGSIYWRTDGEWECPVIVMISCGGYRPGLGPFHSQSLESIAVHTPGIDVVMCSTAGDAAGTLNAAFDSHRPTLFFYPKSCLNLVDLTATTSSDVHKQFVPIGKARIVRTGSDITFVAYGNLVQKCSQAAEALAIVGIQSEVIDLRWLSPWDSETVIASVRKTGKLIVTHEDNHSCGMGGEIMATVAEALNSSVRMKRVTRPDTYIPFNFSNQLEVLPSYKRILESAVDLLDLEIDWIFTPEKSQEGSFMIEAVGVAPSDEVLKVLELCVQVGEEISEGQTVALLETSKAVLDFDSPVNGIIEKIFVGENQKILVGSPLLEVSLSRNHLVAPKPVTREEIGTPVFKQKERKKVSSEASEKKIYPMSFSHKVILPTLTPPSKIERVVSLSSQDKNNLDSIAIVPLKSTGHKIPFFYVHGVTGDHPNVTLDFIKYIDPERPIYGMQALGINGENSPYTKIEDIANYYIQEIQKVVSKGPYLIGGVCMGGSIAFEIAQKMTKHGQEVLPIMMVDSPKPFLLEKDIGFLADTISQQGKFPPPWTYDTEEYLLSVENLTRFRMWKANIKALGNYKPQLYDGKIIYFSATEKMIEGNYFNPTQPNSWKSLVCGGFEMHQIEGNHLSILFDPNAEKLAEKINICLEHFD